MSKELIERLRSAHERSQYLTTGNTTIYGEALDHIEALEAEVGEYRIKHEVACSSLDLVRGERDVAQKALMRQCHETKRLQAELASLRESEADWQRRCDALEAELAALRARVVSVFCGEEIPTFQQGMPTHELQDYLTADDCTVWVQRIEGLKAELASVHEEYKLCRELLMERSGELAALRAKSQEPVAREDAAGAYDAIDHFLRNNLSDDDYAGYSNALETVWNYQHPVVTQEPICPECQGFGMRDSGGVTPWGEGIFVPCGCDNKQPVPAPNVKVSRGAEDAPRSAAGRTSARP